MLTPQTAASFNIFSRTGPDKGVEVQHSTIDNGEKYQWETVGPKTFSMRITLPAKASEGPWLGKYEMEEREADETMKKTGTVIARIVEGQIHLTPSGRVSTQNPQWHLRIRESSSEKHD